MCTKNLLNEVIKESLMENTTRISSLVSKLRATTALKVLDIYPFYVDDNEKLLQVESLYDNLDETDFLNKSKEFQLFDRNLDKFISFFKLLWLKNKKFYVLYSTDYPNFQPKFYDLMEIDLSNEELLLIKDYDYLVSLISRALFERLDLTIILPDENLVFTNSDMSFQIYGAITSTLQKIITTEGLYVR